MTGTTTAGPPGEGRVAARRAIEALRSGVPSRDAVRALGSGQGRVEDQFGQLLGAVDSVRGDLRGLLLGGGFGAGKSHLLEHLAQLALDDGFAISRVVISKETPLHDPAKVLRAAAGSATLPAGARDGVAEAAATLDPGSPAFAELLRRSSGGAPVDERFALTLSLLPRVQHSDGDFAEAIVRFWLGDPIGVADLRRQCRQHGEGRPALRSVSARELARHRCRFLARLFVAAGCQGWVLLFDEVELIGRYSPLQRGRAYAELANWLRRDPEDRSSPLVTVLAMTDDYDAAVLTAKQDRKLVPRRLRAKQLPEWDEVAADAEVGMRLVERSMAVLEPPDDAELDRAYSTLRGLHGEALGWDPPDVAGLERLGATRMRQFVRAWINEWDLLRLDPSYVPSTEASEVSVRYDEDPELAE